MSLKDYQIDQATCNRCSTCKWVPYYRVNRAETLYGCPSISKYKFHAYSGSGKLHVGFSINEGHTKLDMAAADIAYKCTLCGACDFACKTYYKYIDVAENIEELRIASVKGGFTLPAHLEMITSMKKNGNTLKKPKSSRNDWSSVAAIKTLAKGEKGRVMFHAGCKYSYDAGLQEKLQGTVKVLGNAGVDLVTAGTQEACCGGKALQLGYIDAGTAAAKALKKNLEKSGAKTILTSCAHCYSAFKYYYPRHGVDLGVEVLHTTELFSRLVERGDLDLNTSIPMKVTYHDPCNLGRRSEPYKGKYEGNKRERPMELTRTGEQGVYSEPRKLLEAIPGIKLIEMDRTKAWSYCCGAGAGVEEANPGLKDFAASERIMEAEFTETEAVVTACPWCEESLRSAAEKKGSKLKVMDIADLLIQSAGGELR
jgi:heterodisulfide reductase subunit D